MAADQLQQPTIPPEPVWVRLCQWLWNQRGFLWGTVIVGVALNVFASWLVSPSGAILSQTPLGTLLGHPLPLALGGMGLVGLTVGLWLINRRYPASQTQKVATHPLTLQTQQEILHLLSQEYNKVLLSSMQGMSNIPLRLHGRSDITHSVSQRISKYASAAGEQPLPSGTTITQAYDDTGQGGLLILGEPGTGKTTELLHLALALLKRAENDTHLPIPVILNLSSWASKKPPLGTWLIDQIKVTYHISPFISQTLLERDQWLLLLDGLDEVGDSAYADCVEAINRYRAKHFVPMVVCSRSHEYMTQEAWLALSSAVIIQPLEEQQVMEYLKHLGKPMAAVRAALRSSDVLRKLMITPLMLSLVILTYRGKSVREMSLLGSAEEQQKQIFQQYITGMLGVNAAKEKTSPRQALYWLTWLAQQMKQHQTTEFYLERLQPSWLAMQRHQNRYISLARLFIGLCILLEGWLAYILYYGVDFWLQAKSITGLLIGIIAGLFIGFLPGVLGALLIAYFFGPTKKRQEIQPVEVLSWSWETFWLGLRWMLIGVVAWGLVCGVIVALITHQAGSLFSTLVGWLIFGLSSLPAVGILFGFFLPKKQSEHLRIRPNQGIVRSGRNGLLIGLFTLLLAGFVSWLLRGPMSAMNAGSTFGAILGLSLGGRAYLEHYTLRFLLWRSGVLPWHYERFLEEATERKLLQRVGGGYRFMHPLLQDYFASLGTETSPSIQSHSFMPQP